MYAKNFHLSIKDSSICANNPALEDFVIQNHYSEFLRMYAKNVHVSIKVLRVCANNLKFEDFIIQNHHEEFLHMYAKKSMSLLRFSASVSAQNPITTVRRILPRI